MKINPIKLPASDPASTPNNDYVTLLEAALPLIWDGVGERDMFGPTPERYICLAIGEGAPADTPRSVQSALMGLIESRLDDDTFDLWAHNQDVWDDPSIQAGRRAWVLDLAGEFS
jgi:hypothetical protein